MISKHAENGFSQGPGGWADARKIMAGPAGGYKKSTSALGYSGQQTLQEGCERAVVSVQVEN